MRAGESSVLSKGPNQTRDAGIGSIDSDLRTRRVYRSDGILHIFGVSRQELPDRPEKDEVVMG